MESLRRIFLFIFSALLTQAAIAASPTSFTYEGVLTDSSGNTVNLSGVTLTFSIVDSSNCVLYKETRAAGDASGNVSHAVGTGTAANGYSAFNASLFNSTVAGLDATSSTVCSAPASSARKLRVEVASLGISADITLTSVPYALESTTVGGFNSNSLLRAVDGSGVPTSISAFSPTQMTSLTNLINGSSTLYATPSSVTSAINSASLTTTQLTQGGASTGQVLKWNGSAWAPATDAGITSETDPTVQTWAKGAPSARFSTSGNVLDLSVSGVSAGTYGSYYQIPVVTVDSYGRVTNVTQTAITGASPAGSSLSSGQIWVGNSSNLASAVTITGDASLSSSGTLSVNKLRGQTLAGNAPNPGSLLVYNNSLAQWEAQVLPSCTSSETMSFNSVSGAITCVSVNTTNFTGSLAGDVTGNQGTTSLSKIQTKPLTITSLTNGDVLQFNGTAWVNRNIPTCGANQYLTFDGTHYSCANDAGATGTITSVSGTTPIAASTTGGAVTVSLSYDSTTLGLNGSNQLQVKDASITAAKLGGGATGDVLYKTASNWASGSADAAGVVDKTSAQTIAGDKTFTGNLIHSSSGATQIAVGTTAQQPASPNAGMMRLNSSVGKVQYFDGSTWTNVGTVTTVSSLSSYLTVNNSSTSPQISLNVGTGPLTLAAGDDGRITGAVQRSGDSTSGSLNMGSNDLANTGNILMSANKNIQIGNYSSDPNTSSWGAVDKGKTWFNTTTNELKYWDGSGIKVLGVSGSGMQNLNGLTATTQSFAVGTSGIAPAFSSATATHTLNIPMANATSVTAGLISKTEYDTFNSKLGTSTSFAGDVSGTYNSTSVDKIKGTGVSVTTLTLGNFLRYNGSAWVNTMLATSDIASGVLTVARGGTNNGSLSVTAGGLLYTDGTKVMNTGAGTAGQPLISTGVGSPTFGSLGVPAGGTGVTSFSANKIVGTNGTGAALLSVVCPASQVISFDASGNYGCYNVNSLSGSFVNGGNAFGANATLGTSDPYGLNLITGGTSRVFLDTAGNIGLGTTAPTTNLDLQGLSKSLASSPGNLSITTTDSQGAGKGGSISLGGQDGSTGRTFGKIGGFKENSTSNDYAGYLAFATRPNGSNPIERMRIDSYGDVGIGTTAPITPLEVASPSQDYLITATNPGSATPFYPTVNSRNFMGASNGGYPSFEMTNNRGNVSSPAPIQNGDFLGEIDFSGSRDSSGNIGFGATISAFATSSFLSNSTPAALIFGTTPSGSMVSSERMRIDSNGNVSIGTAFSSPIIFDLNGAISTRGTSAAIANSSSGQGRIYFDSTANKFKVSENGGPYVDLVSSGGSTGTVTSVGLTLPSEFTVTGAPVTNSGYLTGSWTSQSPNRVLASPDGATGSPTFRNLTNNDIPALDASKISTGALTADHGGTGLSSFAPGDLFYANGTTTLTRLSHPGTGGLFLRSGISGSLIWDTINTAGLITNGGNSYPSNITIGTSNGFNLSLKTNNTNWMTIDTSGNVGINNSIPSARLDITDTSTATSAIIVPRAAAFTGTTVNGMVRYNSTSNLFEFRQNGAWVNYTTVSDGRLKTNIVPVEQGLDIVNKLNPVYFDWDHSNPRTVSFGNQHQVGFIAQEVEKVLPEVVDKGEDSYRSVEYGKIVAVVVASIKELYHSILKIEESNQSSALELASLKSENTILKARTEKIESENKILKSYLCSKDPNASFCL